MRWQGGQLIVRREVWRGCPWLACPVVVIDDTSELLVTYLPEGTPFRFPRSADGRPHPWAGKQRWQGHGVLMLQHPDEAYAVWHFWEGADRRFVGWYLNLQEPFRRTTIGYDTQDLELDLWLPVDGSWRFKDRELLDERMRDGRYTTEQIVAIRRLGDDLGTMLDRGERWWDEHWASFVPDPSWSAPEFPRDWEAAPIPPAPGADELVLIQHKRSS